MYRSESCRVLFVHIPKSGGTALRRLFPDMEKIGDRHDGLPDLINPRKYIGWQIVAVVRNPYHRLASLYRFEYLSALKWSTDRMIKKYGTTDYRQTPLANFSRFVMSDHQPFRIVQSEYLDHPFLKPTVYHYERIHKAFIILKDRYELDPEPEKTTETHFLGGYRWLDWTNSEGLNYISQFCRRDFDELGYNRM